MGGRGGKGENVNWENPSPPLVISLSSDGTVKAWDVIQVRTLTRTSLVKNKPPPAIPNVLF